MRAYRDFEDYLIESLRDPAEAAEYLNAVLEEDDPELLLAALSDVARAHGLTKVAREVSISRMGLYKALSRKGNPGFRTLTAILKASGVRMVFRPA